MQIFLRGAQLTKVGGRIVYSTCSFNPVENEAVVAEVLRRANGKSSWIKIYGYEGSFLVTRRFGIERCLGPIAGAET